MQQQGSYCLMGVTDLEYSMASWGSKDVGHRNYRGCDLGPNEGSIISDRVIVKKTCGRFIQAERRRGSPDYTSMRFARPPHAHSTNHL